MMQQIKRKQLKSGMSGSYSNPKNCSKLYEQHYGFDNDAYFQIFELISLSKTYS